MSIEIQHDKESGKWSFSFKRHIFVALGLLLVSNGLLTLSGPWWQSIFIGLLGSLNITINDTYQLILGVLQVTLGVGLLSYKHFIIDKHAERKESDKRTITASPLKIDVVRYYLTNLVDDHSYESSFDIAFHNAYTYFKKAESELQLEESKYTYKKFTDAAAQLHNFVAVNFFTFPEGRSATGEYRYCLAPHLNMDRGMTFYDAEKIAEYNTLKTELHERALNTKQLFEEFVSNLKKFGHV
ncbi:hypothetical protein [Methylotenera sp.]|uniref:hypothetical protein n=1 Tax=Methylotenera sp. TaxID=2051956 RepID=UPI002ED833DE